MAKEQVKPTPLPKEPKVDHTALLREEVEMLTEAIQRERADAMNMRRRHDEQIMNLKSTLLTVSALYSFLYFTLKLFNTAVVSV